MVSSYLEFPANTGFDTPLRQLREFSKIELAAGEEKVVTLELTRKALSVWDVRIHSYFPPAGAL